MVLLNFDCTTFEAPNTFRNVQAIETTPQGKILTWSSIGGISGPSHALSLYDEVSCELLMRCETSISFTLFALTSVGNNNSILYGVQGGPEEVRSLVEMRTEINWQYMRVLWIGIRKPLCAETVFLHHHGQPVYDSAIPAQQPFYTRS